MLPSSTDLIIKTEIILAKHRNGSLGTVDLRFLKEFVKFVDMDDSGFSDLPDFDPNPFQAGGIITRSSRMNEETEGEDMDIPF